MKRITDFNTLVIGKRYQVYCGVWQGKLLYCGFENHGKRIYHRFTYADNVAGWKNSFNLYSTKSNFKVFDLD